MDKKLSLLEDLATQCIALSYFCFLPFTEEKFYVCLTRTRSLPWELHWYSDLLHFTTQICQMQWPFLPQIVFCLYTDPLKI